MTSVKIQQKTAELLIWLSTHGCPVDISNIESDIQVEQQDGDDATQLFDLPGGRAAYILDLRIINKGRGPRSIRRVEFEMPWSNSGFQFLPDPRERGGRYKDFYLFPGTGLEYPRDQVLNHVLFSNGILQPNHPAHGVILGIGNPMPREIHHGDTFSGILTIALDSDNPAICEIELWACRSLKKIPTAKTERPEMRRNAINRKLDSASVSDYKPS